MVDHLESARRHRQLVKDIGDDYERRPIEWMAEGRSGGGEQRQHLMAAAVDALIDIAESLRGLLNLQERGK